jgi:DNA-binding NarL/FixJ family response regulator
MDDVRVLIADDQTLMRQGLQTLLEMQAGILVVGQASDGIEALAQTEALKPDVVLMDVRMPGLEGVEATRRIRAQFPNTQVIILTTFDDDEYVFEGLRAGATGYLLKDVSDEELANAIRRVARGEALIEPSVARKVVAEFARLSKSTSANMEPMAPSAGHFWETLSEREMEVLRLVAQGLSNREIADKLFITEGTAKNHVSNILSKLGVRDRVQAVLKAKERKWI